MKNHYLAVFLSPGKIIYFNFNKSFFFKIFDGHMSIFGATDTIVLDFW